MAQCGSRRLPPPAPTPSHRSCASSAHISKCWLTMGPHIHHVSIDEATRDGVTARFPRTTTFEVKESRIVEMVDWLHSADRVALIANEALTTQDTVFEWTRVVLFTFASTGQISRVQLFDDRQFGLDAALARGSQRAGVL
jgi:hypothetical protein